MEDRAEYIPHTPYVPEQGTAEAAASFKAIMQQRRSIRHFSDRDVPLEVIQDIVATACSAPSGANKQPWRFVCVRSAEIKKRIREEGEAEEREFYERRASERWIEDLMPLGTDSSKPFLEIAPWLVVIFKLVEGDNGDQIYYPNESVGIAAGMFIAAAHQAGLATLTHTPSPMKFLASVLDRPSNERPFLLIPVGYPADEVTVPKHAISRKPMDEVMVVV